MEENKKFKILCIDGGGIRGIIPARILTDLEEVLVNRGEQPNLCEYFDLICGTSTGSIIAAGIALGMSAKAILELYTKHAKDIFPSKSFLNKIMAICRNSSFYDISPLKSLLIKAYGGMTRNNDTRLYHCKTRLCIPVYDMSKGEVHVFKTDHLPNYHRDCHIPVVDAVLASSAAPVYFYPHSFSYSDIGTNNTNTYQNNVDGGVFANNPAIVGLMEATNCIGVPTENVEILSIGTGTHRFKSKKDSKRIGSRYWTIPSSGSLNIYDVMASAQSVFTENLMKIISNGPGTDNLNRFKYIRIQTALEEDIKLDANDSNSISELMNYGQDLFKRHGEILKPFLDKKIEQYKHYYK